MRMLRLSARRLLNSQVTLRHLTPNLPSSYELTHPSYLVVVYNDFKITIRTKGRMMIICLKSWTWLSNNLTPFSLQYPKAYRAVTGNDIRFRIQQYSLKAIIFAHFFSQTPVKNSSPLAPTIPATISTPPMPTTPVLPPPPACSHHHPFILPIVSLAN